MKNKTAKAPKHNLVKPKAEGLTASRVIGKENKTADVSPKWRWHYRILMDLRERLLQGCAERRADSAETLERHSMDMADSATDEFDHALAMRDLSAKQDALYEIDEAIQRIQAGSYGICEKTGKAIPAARLKAIPWARFTREAEQELEKEGVISRARISQAHSLREAGKVSLGSTTEELETSEDSDESEGAKT